MQWQLQRVIDEFESATERLEALVKTTSEEQWSRRTDPSRWSIGECVAHLNLTSKAFVPLLKEGLAKARQDGRTAPGRYRRDFIGWMLWKGSGPPVRIRVKTTAQFIPSGVSPRGVLAAEFEELQSQLMACVREAEGLPLMRVRIVSPFDARVKYNIYSALTILPRHQHRHLWQAENI